MRETISIEISENLTLRICEGRTELVQVQPPALEGGEPVTALIYLTKKQCRDASKALDRAYEIMPRARS